jgi:hypothetical protein
MFGSNSTLVRDFPFYVLSSATLGPLITLKRSSDGLVVIVMDVKDKDGKVVVRLDDNGYVIGSRLLISRPDKSTLVVYDEYGQKAIEVHYLNEHVLVFGGYIYVRGQQYRFGAIGGGIQPRDNPGLICRYNGPQHMIVIP